MLYFTRSQRRFIEQYRPGYEDSFDTMIEMVFESTNGRVDMQSVDVAIFAAFLETHHNLTPKASMRKLEAFFNPDQEEPEPVPTADIAAQKLAHLKGYITQYEEGLITLHEMASSAVEKGFQIAEECQDQGCDGLPPNDILPV